MKTTRPAAALTEGAIWARLIQSVDGTLTREAARGLLAINFGEADKARMHELAEKNGAGKRPPAEREELRAYIRVADSLALLHSKARRLLRG